MTLIIFIIVLGILVFVHESGHFLAAKKQGIGVEEFGFGFPPRLVGLQRDSVTGKRRLVWGAKEIGKNEPTVYSLNWIPFGGFVRIKGESGEAANDPDSFVSKSVGRRALVIAMGVIGNIILTAVLLSIGLYVGMPQAIDDQISSYARVRDHRILALNVLPDSPAEQAGIKAADELFKINGQEVASGQQFKDFVNQNVSKEITVTIKRQGQAQDIAVTPVVLKETGKGGIGVGMAEVATVSYPAWLAVPKGIQMTGYLTKAIVVAFGVLLRDLVLGRPVAMDVAGPVGIAVMTGEAARLGWVYLLQFVALLSANLAVINALPLPALDGGRFLFLLIEKFRGRPVGHKVEAIIHNTGFALLLLLVVLVTYHDLARYSGPVVQWASKLVQ